MNIKRYISELKRRNVFKAGAAYLILAWIITQVASIVLPTFNAPPYILKTLLFILALGFPIWIIFSWIYDITSDGIQKTTDIDSDNSSLKQSSNRLNKVIISSLVILVVLLSVKILSNPSSDVQSNLEETIKSDSIKSIAVLPFTNLSSDKEQDYFCLGITEDILNSLSNISDLYVVARTSSFAFNNKNQDIRKIGSELGVNSIIEGSVQKFEDKLRITVQLINVEDGFRLWSKRYNRELKDVFKIQNEIAQNIVEALQLNLNNNEQNQLKKQATDDIEAYDYYIRGREYFHKEHHDKLLLAVNMFNKAIEKDENYALAYSGLADTYSKIYMFFDGDKKYLDQALIASKKALELDDNLSEAHTSRGFALSQNNKDNEAIIEFKKAIKITPNLFNAYYEYARFCLSRDDNENAFRLFQKSASIKPKEFKSRVFLVSAARKIDISKEDLKVLELKAIETIENHLDLYPNDTRALYLGAGALMKLNEGEKAKEWIDKAILLEPNSIALLYNATCFYSILGEKEKALDYFDRTIDTGYSSREWIDTDTDLNNIREEPRFKKALERIKKGDTN